MYFEMALERLSFALLSAADARTTACASSEAQTLIGIGQLQPLDGAAWIRTSRKEFLPKALL
jgi:hypothetical protein